jgi:AcrR family transcriptional regulator
MLLGVNMPPKHLDNGGAEAGGHPARKTRTRSRLLARMTTVAADRGYVECSVEEVLQGTGISRSTFYQHFGEKLSCFIAALEVAKGSFLAELEDRAGAGDTGPAELAAEIVACAQADRARARVLFGESLAGGPRALAIRDQLLGACARLLAQREVASGESLLISRPALIAGLCRLLAIELERGDLDLGQLASDLAAWWQTDLAPAPLYGSRSDRLTEPIEVAPSASIPSLGLDLGFSGDGSQTPGVTARRRIELAVLEHCYEIGYSAMSIEDITRTAGISRKTFYAHFAGKAEATLTTNERVFQAGMMAAAAGFFSAEEWPARAWQGGIALLSFLAANPQAAYLSFVESARVGRGARALIYERAAAFKLFLEEGYRWRTQAGALPRVVSEAVMATMFEWAFTELRRRREGSALLAQLPQLTAVILVPFMGQREAIAAIERLREHPNPDV